MDTPEERLAALVAQAERVLERVEEEPGSTSSDLALSLARAVIKHGKTGDERVGSFSFGLPEPEPDPEAAETPEE